MLGVVTLRILAALAFLLAEAMSVAAGPKSEPAQPLPVALAGALDASPTACPPGLEAYGRAETAQCFTVTLKVRQLEKGVNRFLRERFRNGNFIPSPWSSQDAYRVRRILGSDLYDVLFDPATQRLVLLREKPCFPVSRLEGVTIADGDAGTDARERTSRAHPEYPERARQARTNGSALFQAIVGTTGLVEDVCLVASNPAGFDFEQAGADALRKWTYVPARPGEPRQILMTVLIVWELHY